MPETETFLDVTQAAAMFGLSVATIRKWVWTGYIPYRKIGKAIRFSTVEIQEWVRSKSVNIVKPRIMSGRTSSVPISTKLISYHASIPRHISRSFLSTSSLITARRYFAGHTI